MKLTLLNLDDHVAKGKPRRIHLSVALRDAKDGMIHGVQCLNCGRFDLRLEGNKVVCADCRHVAAEVKVETTRSETG